MDQGFQEGSREGDDCRFDDRLRKAEKRPCPVRPRARPDYDQGYEADSRDQTEEGACVLEEQNGGQQRQGARTSQKEAGVDQIARANIDRRCTSHGQGENQGLRQIKECSTSWRGTVNGHGSRLDVLSLFPLYVLLSMCFQTKKSRPLCSNSRVMHTMHT